MRFVLPSFPNSIGLLLFICSTARAVREVRRDTSSSSEFLLVKRWNLVQNRNRQWQVRSPLVLVESTQALPSYSKEHELKDSFETYNDTLAGSGVHETVAVTSSPSSNVSRQLAEQQRQTCFVMMLGALCGTMDALFCHHYECYANMMTGNTIKLATALAHGELGQAALFAGLILAYTSGCSLWQVLLMRQQQQKQQLSSIPLSKRARLRRIIPMTILLFVLADLVSQTLHPKLFLPVMSIAFGLVNTATIDSIGVVTNAATGHVSKIGMGLVGCFVSTNGSSSSSTGKVNLPNIPPQNVGYLATFAGSIVVTTKLYEAWTRHPLTAAWLQKVLPPMGLVLGCLYSAALWWFTSEPLEEGVPAS